MVHCETPNYKENLSQTHVELQSESEKILMNIQTTAIPSVILRNLLLDQRQNKGIKISIISLYQLFYRDPIP